MAWLLGTSDGRVVLKTRWPSKRPLDSQALKSLLVRKWPSKTVLSPREVFYIGRGKCITVAFSLSSDKRGEQRYGDRSEWVVCGVEERPVSEHRDQRLSTER